MRCLLAGLLISSVFPGLASGELLRLHLTPVHYRLRITVDYEASRLEGRAAITVRNWSAAPVDSVPLTLYRLMTLDAAETPAGQPLAYRQDVVTYEDFSRLQVLAAQVRLARALAPDDTTTIVVRWGGHLLGYAETGMEYVQDRIDPAFTIIRPDAQAYPQVAYPSWAANRRTPWPSFTYHAALAVPESLTVANGGRLLERRVEGGRATFVYESIRPSSRMDFAIARYETMAAAPIRIDYLPGDARGAAGVLHAARASFGLFTEWFGPLRGVNALTFIEIPDGWGSQTDVTTVIQSAGAFRDSTRYTEVYHEVSHLWNPADRDTPSSRWNEGLAMYLQVAVTEELQGVPARDAQANRFIGWLRDNLSRRPQWSQVPLARYGEAQLTDLSYRVGALFFDLLERSVGAAQFRAMIRDYCERYAADGGSLADLKAVIREHSGSSTERLLHDWIDTPEWTKRIEKADSIDALAAVYAHR